MSIRIIRCPFKLSALAITLSLNITESQATTVTSPEAAVPPVNIDTVLNYGYAGILASSFLNVPGYGNATNPTTNQPGVSWGNYNFTWYYFNSCPQDVYNSKNLDCECQSGTNQSQQQGFPLYFGNNSTTGGTTSFSSGFALTQSVLTQTQADPLSLTYAQVDLPTTPISFNGIAYAPGDVMYTILAPWYDGGGSANEVGMNLNNAVIFSTWNVTGTVTWDVDNAEGCASTDKGANKTASSDANVSDGRVNSYGQAGTVSLPLTIPSTTVSASNPLLVITAGTQTLSSSAGTNTAVAMTPVNDVAPSIPNGNVSTVNLNTANTTTQQTIVVGASQTQQTTQTIQNGTTSSQSSTFNNTQTYAISDTAAITVAPVPGTSTGVSDSLTGAYTTAFNESYTNVTGVTYSNTTASSATTSSNMSITSIFYPTTSTSTTTTVSGTGTPVTTTTTGTTTTLTQGAACYIYQLINANGVAYMDATATTVLSGEYGTISALLNGTTNNFQNPVAQIANTANLLQWWDSQLAPIGSGTPTSVIVSGSNVQLPGNAQLTSTTQSDITLNITESASACSSTSSAALLARTSSAPTHAMASSSTWSNLLPWVSASDLADKTNTGFPSGRGIPAHQGVGFHVDERTTHSAHRYIGSTANDLLFYGDGQDFIQAGDGDDIVHAGGSQDLVLGGKGRNSLFGEGGDDVLIAGPGIDNLIGGEGNDSLLGGGGTDHYVPGPGNNKLYLDPKAENQIDGLSFRDSVQIGQFRANAQGKLLTKSNVTAKYALKAMPQIGFVGLVEKATGTRIGIIRTAYNFSSARPAVWTDLALVNYLTLPKAVFDGYKPTQQGQEALATHAKNWYLEKGFSQGATMYRYADWSELRNDPEALNTWIKKVARNLLGTSLPASKLQALAAEAVTTSSAAGFIKKHLLATTGV
jgi:hypothetical protein